VGRFATGVANIGRGIGRKYMAVVRRLEASQERTIAAINASMGGSYAGAVAREEEAVATGVIRAQRGARALPSVNTPEPSVRGVVARPGGGARPLEEADEGFGVFASRSQATPPRPPAPLMRGEIERIAAENAARDASVEGGRVRLAFKEARANNAIEKFPEIEGVNSTGGTTNCVHCQNALSIRRTEGVSATANEVETPVRGPSNAFNPHDAKWVENLNISNVVNRVKAAGPGAEFHLRGIRDGVDGHRMGVINRNGVVYFVDGQAESFGDVSRAQNFVSFWLMRYK
jgi:hypothetical protein